MTITAYGLCAALSLALMLLAAGQWYTLRERIGYNVWIRLCVTAIPLALVCSRLLFSASSLGNGDFTSPVQTLYFRDGGASITGAFIGVVLAAMITAKTCKVSCRKLLDGLAIGAPAALITERLAEYRVEMSLGKSIGTASLEFLGSSTDGRHPVFAYEAVIAGILLIVLLVIGLRKGGVKHKGDLMLMFLTLYGTTQVLMESLREDFHMVIYYIRINQIAALIMAVIAFVIWMIRWARKGARPLSMIIAALLVVIGIVLGIVQEFAVDSNPNMLLEYAIMALALALIAAVSLTVRRKAE